MALETPNRLVASMVLYGDAAAPLGERLIARSSNGIARKVDEVFLPALFPAQDANLASWELEQPLSNDEALVVTQFTPDVVLAGPWLSWVTPAAQLTGVAAIDTLAPNLLATLFFTFTGTRSRVSLMVFGMQTTATPIPGEPLP